ncbi:MAG: Gfo/Idh/MocA family protein [Actinomycetales bacterium]
MRPEVRIGVIGAGLMGRELAVVCGRWMQLVDHPVVPRITAVADVNPAALDWVRQVGSVTTLTDDWRRLVDDSQIDVLYIAVPHDRHQELYVAAAEAGKDFLGEKPFGIDVAAAGAIMAALAQSTSFVRVSSELPYFPGAQACARLAASGALGDIIEVRAGFAHSSDMDRAKPVNWKRRRSICGEIGVMGDLGMHVAHIPLRLGWMPHTVYAMLDDIVTERPSPGDPSRPDPCDTYDNALLACRVRQAERSFGMLWETKRLAPGQTNTWWFEALGMDGGVRFSTRYPTTVERFEMNGKVQEWIQYQPGNVSAWPVISAAIFEFGFSDALMQMWAAYLAERAGALGDRFGTATPQEAYASHLVFDAALRSGQANAVMPVG